LGELHYKVCDRANRPENLEVEPEVDTDQTGPSILHSEVQTDLNQIRDKKATGNDGEILGEVLQLLGEEGHKLVTQMIYEVSDRTMISWKLQ
jgi:hypothetical protein